MLDYSQLAALLTIEETGTYEGAARELNLTSFAVKQRIKTLEAKLGVKLLESSPTRPSKVGRVLCDHTRRVRSLEENVVELHSQDSPDDASDNGALRVLSVAICDEVFADWFVDVLDHLNQMEAKPALDISPAPKTQIVGMMRSGAVVAALSHHTQEIYGFKTYPRADVKHRKTKK